ncbi:RNA chaperone ProQ [Agarivorans sp.]|uniref:RNA chaperone ProQ n=1 Tax=Agarivorans sp. TaxID=1872412 RepID=UPI003D000DB0
MEQTNKLKNSKEVIQYLATQFPNCFSTEGEAKPLKIGIFQDLAERLKEDEKVSNTVLRSALRQYTSSWRYLHGVKVGSKRVDLDGVEGAEIEQEHVEHAQKTLKESKDKAFANKKAQAEKANKAKPAAKAKADFKRTSKPKPSSTKPVAEPKPVEKLDSKDLVAGKEVRVLVGKTPMPGQISEVTKDGIAVTLKSGMLVKVKAEHIVA